MTKRTGKRTFLLFLLAAAAMAATATRGEAGSTGNGSAGSGMSGFGSLSQYRYEADAQKACHGDTIVWGSSANRGKFFTKDAGPQRISGFYACMSDARRAGYEIVTGE